jgi:hypothetical protein
MRGGRKSLASKNLASLIHLHGRRPHEDASSHIRGALAVFFRGASCSVKFREPIGHDRIIDLSTRRCKVNAGNKNKRVLFVVCDQERMNTLSVDRGGKERFANDRAAIGPRPKPVTFRCGTIFRGASAAASARPVLRISHQQA